MPRCGHIYPKMTKQVVLTFKSMKSVVHKDFAVLCETRQIRQSEASFVDWDDSMSNVRYVTQSEYDWYTKRREEEEARRRSEEQ